MQEIEEQEAKEQEAEAAAPDSQIFLDWQTFGIAGKELTQIIMESGYKPDIILGIARGGLFLAGSLGYNLSVKNIFIMNVEYYTGKNQRLEVPIVLPPYLELTDIEDSKVLIADDVADTGHTLELVKEHTKGKVAEVRTAVLYQKPCSISKPEYVWQSVEGWIHFPWSSD